MASSMSTPPSAAALSGQREDVVVMDSSEEDDDALPRPPASAGRSAAASVAESAGALPERGSFSRQRGSTMPPRVGAAASVSRQSSSSRGASVETAASTARGSSNVPAAAAAAKSSPTPTTSPAGPVNTSATASPAPRSEGSVSAGGGRTVGSAEVRALLDDAKEVLVLLTKEIVRLRNEKCEYELRLRDEELVDHRTRVAELDESYLKRFGPKASPLPSLDNGGALDRDVLVARISDAESKATELERRLRKKKGEADRLRAELRDQVDARQEDLAAIQKLARQSAAVAAKLDVANNEIAAGKKREEALKRRANEVTSQVREATRGTIESLEQALSEALEHNRILGAELALAKQQHRRGAE